MVLLVEDEETSIFSAIIDKRVSLGMIMEGLECRIGIITITDKVRKDGNSVFCLEVNERIPGDIAISIDQLDAMSDGTITSLVELIREMIIKGDIEIISLRNWVEGQGDEEEA